MTDPTLKIAKLEDRVTKLERQNEKLAEVVIAVLKGFTYD